MISLIKSYQIGLLTQMKMSNTTSSPCLPGSGDLSVDRVSYRRMGHYLTTEVEIRTRRASFAQIPTIRNGTHKINMTVQPESHLLPTKRVHVILIRLDT